MMTDTTRLQELGSPGFHSRLVVAERLTVMFLVIMLVPVLSIPAGVKKAHDWAVEELVDLFLTTHRVKTMKHRAKTMKTGSTRCFRHGSRFIFFGNKVFRHIYTRVKDKLTVKKKIRVPREAPLRDER